MNALDRSRDPVSRRTLLRRGFVGGALLLLAGAAKVFFAPTRRRTAPGRLAVLDETEASILAAVAETVLGLESGAPSAETVDVVGRVDATLARGPAADGRDFARLLRLFENGWTGLATGTATVAFSAASPAARAARLHAWETSRIALFRTGFQAMKRLCAACYYSSPRSWPTIGYPGPPEILA